MESDRSNFISGERKLIQRQLCCAPVSRDTICPSFFPPKPFLSAPTVPFPTLAGINSDVTANETGCGQIKSRLTTHLGRFSRHLLLPFRFQRCFASFVSSSLVLTWYRTLDYSLCDFFSREMLLFDFV